MTGMEWFGNIGRRKLDYDPFASLFRISGVLQAEIFVLPKVLFSFEDRRYEDFCKLVDFEEELEKRPSYRGLVDERRLGKLRRNEQLAGTHLQLSSAGIPFLPILQQAQAVSCLLLGGQE